MKKKGSMIFAFVMAVCLLLPLSHSAEAEDYWVYSDDGGSYYVDTDQTDFRPPWGDKHAHVIATFANGKRANTLMFYFTRDEGQWWYSVNRRGSGELVEDNPIAVAIRDFCVAHWNSYGFHE